VLGCGGGQTSARGEVVRVGGGAGCARRGLALPNYEYIAGRVQHGSITQGLFEHYTNQVLTVVTSTPEWSWIPILSMNDDVMSGFINLQAYVGVAGGEDELQRRPVVDRPHLHHRDVRAATSEADQSE